MKYEPFEYSSQRPNHSLAVWFDAPSDRMICHYQKTQLDRKDFRQWLSIVASWFTEKQQDFLQTPSWNAFNKGTEDLELPIVTIKGFTDTIKNFSDEFFQKDDLFINAKFNRENIAAIKRGINNVEIRWIEWSLNLGLLFSPEGKAQWIVYYLRKDFSETDLTDFAESFFIQDRLADIFEEKSLSTDEIGRCYLNLFKKVDGCRTTKQFVAENLLPKHDRDDTKMGIVNPEV